MTIQYLATIHISAKVLPADVSFRLFCLLSRCCSPPGLSAADYSRLKKLLCDAYGYRHAATLARLERAGLLCPPGGTHDRHRLVRSKLGLASPPSAASRADKDVSILSTQGFCQKYFFSD